MFTWIAEHDDALQKIKNAMTKTPVLKYFNSKEETTLQCDASQSGLGAALMQNGQPVSYASRDLTETEQQYAPIEKEMLAIVYGLDKFHSYTYGRRIAVEADHKPIKTIHMKPLHTAQNDFNECS